VLHSDSIATRLRCGGIITDDFVMNLLLSLRVKEFLPRDAKLAIIVCLSVCLSQVGVLLKWLNVGSHKQCHMIAQGL